MLIPNDVLITGGAGYIGTALRQSISRVSPNTRVEIADIRDSDGFRGDLTDHNVCSDLISQFLSECSGPPGIVLAAGAAVFSPTEARTQDEAMSVIAINLLAPLWILKALVDVGYASSSPMSVVLVSSVFGRFVPDFSVYEHLGRRSSEVYGASKAGLEQLGRYFSKAYPERMRVNCVAPGGVFDQQQHSQDFVSAYGRRTAQGRMVTSDEVASTIMFLLSAESRGIVGQTIAVDSGYGL